MSRVTLNTPFSMFEMLRVEIPLIDASSSWVQPLSCRNAITLLPKFFLISTNPYPKAYQDADDPRLCFAHAPRSILLAVIGSAHEVKTLTLRKMFSLPLEQSTEVRDGWHRGGASVYPSSHCKHYQKQRTIPGFLNIALRSMNSCMRLLSARPCLPFFLH